MRGAFEPSVDSAELEQDALTRNDALWAAVGILRLFDDGPPLDAAWQESDGPSVVGGAYWAKLAVAVKIELLDAVDALARALYEAGDRLGVGPMDDPAAYAPLLHLAASATASSSGRAVTIARFHSAARHIFVACGQPVPLNVALLFSADPAVVSALGAGRFATMAEDAVMDLHTIGFGDVRVRDLAAALIRWSVENQTAGRVVGRGGFGLSALGLMVFAADEGGFAMPAMLGTVHLGLSKALAAPKPCSIALSAGLSAIPKLFRASTLERPDEAAHAVESGLVETCVRAFVAWWALNGPSPTAVFHDDRVQILTSASTMTKASASR